MKELEKGIAYDITDLTEDQKEFLLNYLLFLEPKEWTKEDLNYYRYIFFSEDYESFDATTFSLSIEDLKIISAKTLFE